MPEPHFVRTNLDNLSCHLKTNIANESKEGVPALAAIDKLHTSYALALHFEEIFETARHRYERTKFMTAKFSIAAAFSAVLALPAAATDIQWDVSIPWGASEFHTQNAMAFAERVAEETNGKVVMTIHPGGSLGIRANESLRAVEDGAVPVAEYALFQNVGDVPILGIESIPFLIQDYADLRRMHELVRPAWQEAIGERNQKVLYIVPWPSQNFFTSEPLEGLADFEGMQFRTYDANTTTMISNLGAVPNQMNSADVVPALATGRLDAVMTSGTTAVAQSYWEFLNHTYTTNHLWASNALAVNLDEWNALNSEIQAKIEAIAAEMEPGFWEISEGEHAKRMQQLMDRGMTVQAPTAELAAAMREATATMADDFAARVPGSGEIIEAFLASGS
ncbi:MAG: TRAP transporter substrate-binding protein [Rhodobacter sp.]|nr:TRAP transporter substrate-binding protein [Rhodobacter sp.]MCY4169495.1 TRAP transporter substrate-binding protein [Rhodobacter sp.]